MNAAEYIIVTILAIALFVFLVTGTVLLIKLIDLANEAKKVVAKGQEAANKASDMVGRATAFTTVSGAAKAFTAVSGLAKSFTDKYNKTERRSNGKK